jgi:hypothetical protein
MQRMTIPNRELNHVEPYQSAEKMRDLMARIGKTQLWVADQTGISRRRIQYLLVGSKNFAGEMQAVSLTYCEQFALECLAEAGEIFKSKPSDSPPTS